MIDFIKISDSCINLLGGLFFVREIIKVALFAIPFLLVAMLTLDFTKGVISFDFNDDKTLKIVINRTKYAVALLLVPITIFGVLKAVGLTVTDSESCWAYVDENSVADIKAKLSAKQKEIQQETERLITDIANRSKMSLKDKESTRKIVASSNDTSDNKNTSDNTDTDIGKGNGNITLDWDDLSKISNIESSAKLAKALNKTKNLKKWSTYATDLYNAERKYKVNAFFLIGLQAHESYFMKSAISKDCNNLGGVTGKPTCSGHKNFRKFSSKNEFMKQHAKLLNGYIKKGKKSLTSIGGTYCGSGCSDWVPGTKKFGNQIYKKAKEI